MVAGNIAHLDGIMLSRSGRGIEELNPRQMCNFVYAVLLENKNEEERDTFLFELYLPMDPLEAADAISAKLRQPPPAG